jgi:hypothetical protein
MAKSILTEAFIFNMVKKSITIVELHESSFIFIEYSRQLFL